MLYARCQPLGPNRQQCRQTRPRGAQDAMSTRGSARNGASRDSTSPRTERPRSPLPGATEQRRLLTPAAPYPLRRTPIIPPDLLPPRRQEVPRRHSHHRGLRVGHEDLTPGDNGNAELRLNVELPLPRLGPPARAPAQGRRLLILSFSLTDSPACCASSPDGS